MHITWLGMSCFKITSGETTIVIDPYQDKFGLKMPKAKADIVVSSNPDADECNNFKRMMGDFFLIKGPGEYERNDIFIYGVQAGEGDQKGSTIYLLDVNDMKVSHLGMINHSLTDKQLETMEGADILLLPVSSLLPEKRTKIISQIDPRMIVPMYYKIPNCKAKLETLDKFIKETGGKPGEAEEKLIIKKKDLPQDKTNVAILNAG